MELALSWQAEAQLSQETMDEHERNYKRGVSSREYFDCGYYYWRGRRDGFETAAYDVLVGGCPPPNG